MDKGIKMRILPPLNRESVTENDNWFVLLVLDVNTARVIEGQPTYEKAEKAADILSSRDKQRYKIMSRSDVIISYTRDE